MANAKNAALESGGVLSTSTIEYSEATAGQTALTIPPPSANLATGPSTALTPMALLQTALTNNAAIDVIERLAALQEKAMAREAEVQFNEAMNKVQADIKRVAPDETNPQTRSKYATYAALDRKIRPIYSAAGFSLSFNTEESHLPEHLRAVCYLSLGAHTRKYQVDMPCDGKGAKGGDVMTKTHAAGAAMSYGMRYLLKYIFNVAIGEEDQDGNEVDMGELTEQLEWIANARNQEERLRLKSDAVKKFDGNSSAIKAILAASNKRKAELG